jgi:hypothetical protein
LFELQIGAGSVCGFPKFITSGLGSGLKKKPGFRLIFVKKHQNTSKISLKKIKENFLKIRGLGSGSKPGSSLFESLVMKKSMYSKVVLNFNDIFNENLFEKLFKALKNWWTLPQSLIMYSVKIFKTTQSTQKSFMLKFQHCTKKTTPSQHKAIIQSG